MRNLRLYNNDEEFRSEELAIANNEDLSSISSSVPGIALTKNNRKVRYNPKNASYSHQDITIYYSIPGNTTDKVVPNSAISEVKYIVGETRLTPIACQAPNPIVCSGRTFELKEPIEYVTVPSSLASSVTFEYVPRDEEMFICKYNITDTVNPTKLFNHGGSYTRYPSYVEIDGKAVNPRSASTFTFTTTGIHEVKAIFRNNYMPTFESATSLVSIVIPNYITSLETYMFKNCTQLTSITFSNKITRISYGCFESCSSLTSLTLPDSVTYIESYSFRFCTNLEKVVLGSSLTELGTYIFEGCSALTEIVCKTTTPPTVSSYTFYNIRSNGMLTVPRGTPIESGSEYRRTWLQSNSYYLGYYAWGIQWDNN